MAKFKDIPSALHSFEEEAILHGQATWDGKYKLANKSYRKLMQVVDFLKERNELASLETLLPHASESVKIWAATFVLNVNESEGIRVLEEVSKGQGHNASTARLTLQEWRRGNLRL